MKAHQKCQECSEHHHCKFIGQENCPYDFGSSEKEAEALRYRVAELERKLDKSNYWRNNYSQAVKDAEKERDALKVENASLEKARANWESQARFTMRERYALKVRCDELERDLSEARKLLAVRVEASRLDASIEERDSLRARVSELSEKVKYLEDVHSRLGISEALNDDLRDKVAELEQERISAVERANAERHVCEQVEKERDALKAQLDAMTSLLCEVHVDFTDGLTLPEATDLQQRIDAAIAAARGDK